MSIISVRKKDDLSKWYERVIYYSGIASPGLVKGTLFINPLGWFIWNKIKKFLDSEFEKIGIKNVCFPSLIPLSEINKEKEHIKGFNPELFLVSKTGDEKANSFLRPTSEILFSYYFGKTLQSYEQLPIMLNQWCNVFRAEKNTKTFLRNCEFYWQEAHTLHKTKDEAMKYLFLFHDIYKKMVQEFLGMAVLCGEKTVGERFAGAEKTLTLEAIMPDGQSLQIATSHYLGQRFSESFEVKYTNSKNQQEYPYQLSAGSSTRLLGALIMDHADDLGLVLPFDVSEVQIKVIVINKAIDETSELYSKINKMLRNYVVGWDFSNKTFGHKLKQEELVGTPFVVAIGYKEIELSSVLVKCRNINEKSFVFVDDLESFFEGATKAYVKSFYEKSLESLNNSIVESDNLDDVKKQIFENKKIVLVPWFDDENNEEKFKQENFGFGPRCIKERIDPKLEIKCFYSKEKANSYVYFGRSY